VPFADSGSDRRPMPKRIAICAAAVVVALGLRFALFDESPVGLLPRVAASGQELLAVDAPTSASAPADEGVIQALSTPIALEAPVEPEYAEPTQVEDAILQLLAQQPRLALVSINSVKCSATTCEIAFSGADLNSRAVGPGAMEIQTSLFAQRWADVRVLSSGVGTREIVPGARETVFSFEYQPLVDLSDDPLIAARQQARCSAAWVRQTTNPTPDDVVRQYLEIAQQRLVLASAVLGEEEAERIAARTHGGPLIRECGLTPW
jgi:hypothetical protein